MFNNLKEDLKRNDNKMSKIAVVIYRYGNWIYYKVKIPIVRQLLYLIYKILNFIYFTLIAGAEVPAKCKIGKGLVLAHGAKGIVINPEVIIGENAYIIHHVTIGSIGNGIPKVGNNVLIGVGAKILGDVTIGNSTKIGANATVVKDVPDGCTAVSPAASIKM